MSKWIFGSAVVGALLGCWLQRYMKRWAIEATVVLHLGREKVEVGNDPERIFVDARGRAFTKYKYLARRFWTRKGAERGVAKIILSGEFDEWELGASARIESMKPVRIF